MKLKPDGIAIIDTTLREGEQFATASFDRRDKVKIARLLDAFGVAYIELTSPAASPQSAADCEMIANLDLRAKVLTHIRCQMDDARLAVATGVSGVNVVVGTSSYLQQFSHGMSIERILEQARQVVDYLLSQGIEVRFSTEDSLRSNLVDLLRVYQAVDDLGINRVGIADTVGIGTPRQIYDLIKMVKSAVRADIEFHGHNDTGCAIANSLAALEAGATHINTTVLGIGERNGITPLGGLIARLYAIDANLVREYELTLLQELDELVANLVGVAIPFNNYITGRSAFAHKAGIHTKAVINNPATYEILSPEAFGVARQLHVAHKLTGRHAVAERARQLGFQLDEQQQRAITSTVKAQADISPFTLNDLDQLIQLTVRPNQ